MAKIHGLLPYALIAAREGATTRQFGAAMRALGLGARSSEMEKLMSIAKGILAADKEEPFRDIRFAPLPSEMKEWSTKSATGVRQNVAVIVRERVTGQLRVVPYSAYSDTGVTREQAMAAAINAYSGRNEQYNSDVIGTIHRATLRYVPSGF
jgi:hypothetical protein